MIYPLNIQVYSPKIGTIINNLQQFRNTRTSIFRTPYSIKKAAWQTQTAHFVPPLAYLMLSGVCDSYVIRRFLLVL